MEQKGTKDKMNNVSERQGISVYLYIPNKKGMEIMENVLNKLGGVYSNMEEIVGQIVQKHGLGQEAQ